jgi:DNA-binding response OmpR family regulator
MSNAAKFSPLGSKVEISAARHHDGRVRIAVTDYGPGIPEDFKSRIFQPFTQSDASDTRTKGGTGLGLAISKAIIERHGGQIDFITREGIGSTFYIELPEMRGSEESGADEPHMLPGSLRACVLIVEDDPDIAALIRRMMTEAGFDSDIACTAGQARQLLDEQGGQYRLMTLDLMLPDEDGMSLLESLRRNAATRELPVVVVSLEADEVKRQLVGGALDIRDWLQKPIDAERLIGVVRAACGTSSQPQVLHVEDEADTRAIVRAMLQPYCEVKSADTIEAAREALARHKFDLVLLDIGLPDGSGLDLIEIIGQHVSPPRIVIFSAMDVSKEYADKVSAVMVKSRTGNEELLRILLQSMRNV